MPDLNNIESRLVKLEEKAKANFFEIDRRLIDIEATKPTSAEERVRYVEDLLLLMQIENEKMKQILAMTHVVPVAENTSLGEIEERLQRLEEHMPESALEESPLSKKINDLDKCLSEALENFNKRLISIEENVSVKREKKEQTENSGVLEEVHGILHA